jgi:hypothetical protein
VSRKPRDWKPPQSAGFRTDVVQGVTPAATSGIEPAPPVFGGVVSPAPNVGPVVELAGPLGPVVEPTPEVITTVKADEPIPPFMTPNEMRERLGLTADGDPLPHDENEPGRWVPPSVEYAVGSPEEWLGVPLSIRAVLAAAIANPGPWPNAERLGRLQRHLEEVINALPEAIEAATDALKEDLETLKDILA